MNYHLHIHPHPHLPKTNLKPNTILDATTTRNGRNNHFYGKPPSFPPLFFLPIVIFSKKNKTSKTLRVKNT